MPTQRRRTHGRFRSGHVPSRRSRKPGVRPQGTPASRLERGSSHAPGLRTPRFPALPWRSTGVADWHLDAIVGPVLARLPAQRLGPHAGPGRFCRSDSGLPPGTPWRQPCRYAQQAQDHPAHPDRLDAAGVRAGGADAHRAGAVLACVRSGVAAGSRERGGRPGAAGIPGGACRPGRPHERHRAQLLDVQRGKDRRPGESRESWSPPLARAGASCSMP